MNHQRWRITPWYFFQFAMKKQPLKENVNQHPKWAIASIASQNNRRVTIENGDWLNSYPIYIFFDWVHGKFWFRQSPTEFMILPIKHRDVHQLQSWLFMIIYDYISNHTGGVQQPKTVEFTHQNGDHRLDGRIWWRDTMHCNSFFFVIKLCLGKSVKYPVLLLFKTNPCLVSLVNA